MENRMMSSCSMGRRHRLDHQEQLSALPLRVDASISINVMVPECKRMRMTEIFSDEASLKIFNAHKISSKNWCVEAVPAIVGETQDSPQDNPLHITDLPDELWFRTYSFLHTTSPCESLSINELFQTVNCVSKEENARLMRYVRQVPQDFRYEEGIENLDALIWACRNGMKLGKVDFRTCDSPIEFNLCLLMLRSCNIRDMQVLKIKNFWLANDKHKSQSILQQLIKAGIPADEVNYPMNPVDFQKQISTCVKENTRALRKICIESKHDELYMPFFTNFSRTLNDVTVKLFEGMGSTDCLQELMDAVNEMPKLKKLKMNACMKASVSVKSMSLKKIDVKSSLGGFVVKECICPSLTILRASYFVEDKCWNGVMPMAKIEMQKALENNYVKEKCIVDIQAGSNEFHGMLVPDSCNVRLYLHKKNFV